MGLVQEIDTICTEMLRNLVAVNTYIAFDGNVFGRCKDDAEAVAYNEMHWSHALRAAYVKKGEKVDARIVNWHSHSIGITGLVLDGVATVDEAALRRCESFTLSARTVIGFGHRAFFEALGARHVLVKFKPDVAFSDDSYWSYVEVEAVEVKLFDESASQLLALRDKLLEQKLAMDKQFALSALSGRFSNFHALTGIPSSKFYAELTDANTFDSLFQ